MKKLVAIVLLFFTSMMSAHDLIIQNNTPYSVSVIFGRNNASGLPITFLESGKNFRVTDVESVNDLNLTFAISAVGDIALIEGEEAALAKAKDIAKNSETDAHITIKFKNNVATLETY